MPAGRHAFKGIHNPGMGCQALRVEVRCREEGITLRVCNAGAVMCYRPMPPLPLLPSASAVTLV